MKLTLNLPDDLYLQAESTAKAVGQSATEWITEIITKELRQPSGISNLSKQVSDAGFYDCDIPNPKTR